MRQACDKLGLVKSTYCILYEKKYAQNLQMPPNKLWIRILVRKIWRLPWERKLSLDIEVTSLDYWVHLLLYHLLCLKNFKMNLSVWIQFNFKKAIQREHYVSFHRDMRLKRRSRMCIFQFWCSNWILAVETGSELV